MSVLAVDPGPVESAYVLFDGDRLVEFGKVENEVLLSRLEYFHVIVPRMAIEMIASYGMPVGAEVFETCVWIGRFAQAWNGAITRVFRKDVKIALCGSVKAKDGNVRQALIDRYGGKDKAIGKKASPGPLYGVSADVWAALAVAVTHQENVQREA